MNDILRTLRLGVIDLLGVTVPGLILLFLLLFGFIAPSLLIVADWVSPPGGVISSANPSSVVGESVEPRSTSTLRNLPPLGYIPGSVLLGVVLILAYVIGYVLRLSTPDELDKKSTEIVLNEMEREKHGAVEADKWPIRLNEKENKFPYFHFEEYLRHRKHDDLAAHVKWGTDIRSKTCVNKMKLETSLRSPHLSAIIESNEAHIRLLFGTWSACRVCLVFIAVGAAISVLGFVVSLLDAEAPPSVSSSQFCYATWVLITFLLLLGTITGKRQIERLFHYRRVRELFDVVACYHLACKYPDLGGHPNQG